jgi:hypothetical protein
VAVLFVDRPSAWILSWETEFLSGDSYGPRPPGSGASVPALFLGQGEADTGMLPIKLAACAVHRSACRALSNCAPVQPQEVLAGVSGERSRGIGNGASTRVTGSEAWTNAMSEWENCRDYIGGVLQ